jgi:hypothetical protein
MTKDAQPQTWPFTTQTRREDRVLLTLAPEFLGDAGVTRQAVLLLMVYAAFPDIDLVLNDGIVALIPKDRDHLEDLFAAYDEGSINTRILAMNGCHLLSLELGHRTFTWVAAVDFKLDDIHHDYVMAVLRSLATRDSEEGHNLPITCNAVIDDYPLYGGTVLLVFAPAVVRLTLDALLREAFTFQLGTADVPLQDAN